MLIGISAEYLIGSIAVWLLLPASLYIFVRALPWRPNRPLLRRFAPFLLLLWTVVFLAAAAENGFALFYDQTDSFGLTKTHERWYTRHVKKNNWKFRDNKDFTPALPAGVRRIAVLGDSFAFGHGVPNVSDRLGERLQRMLAEKIGDRDAIQVVNAADPGADTPFELKILNELERRGMKMTDVLWIYNLNDIEGLVPELDQDMMGSILCPQPAEWNWPTRHLYLPNFLYYRYVQYSRPEVRDYFGWLKTAYQGKAWEQQKTRLEDIIEWCRKRNVALRVAIFPFLHNLENYAFESSHAELANYFRSQNVPVLDLLPTMKDHRTEKLIVNRYDAHPNERAHELAAEAIFKAFYSDDPAKSKEH